MTTKNKTKIAKEGEEPTVQEITDPEADEVSIVDRPANQEPFLLIKSAGASADEGEDLKLPINAEGILALAKSLGDSGEHLGKLSTIVARAVSEEGATFPESLTAEITKAVELLGEHYKPTEVEKTEEPVAAEPVLDPSIAFTAAVYAIRKELATAREASSEDLSAVIVLLKTALEGSSAIAAASAPVDVSAKAFAADDLAKFHAELPDSEAASVQETGKLLKQLEIAIRPSASIQKSFDAYRTAAEERETALAEQNQRLRKALQEAVALVAGRVTPLAKSLGAEPRPAPQSTAEGVLSHSTPQAAHAKPVHWGDLAAEVEAEERAAKGGQ